MMKAKSMKREKMTELRARCGLLEKKYKSEVNSQAELEHLISILKQLESKKKIDKVFTVTLDALKIPKDILNMKVYKHMLSFPTYIVYRVLDDLGLLFNINYSTKKSNSIYECEINLFEKCL